LGHDARISYLAWMRKALATVVTIATLGLVGCVTPSGPSAHNGAAGAVTSPPAVNAAAEPIAGSAAKTWATTAGNPPPTILRAFVLDKDWMVETDPATNKPTDRHMRVAVDYKGGASGTCHRWQCLMHEPPSGDGWGAASITCAAGMTANVRCESINAERGSPP
jgi:hypothetical protein